MSNGYHNILSVLCMLSILYYVLGHKCYLRIYSKYQIIINPKWEFLLKKFITFFNRKVVNWSNLSFRLCHSCNNLFCWNQENTASFLHYGPSHSPTTHSLIIKNLKIHYGFPPLISKVVWHRAIFHLWRWQTYSFWHNFLIGIDQN